MEKEPRKTTRIEYDTAKNIVYIGAPKSAFVPEYLNYVLEYLKIPKTAKRVFEPEHTKQSCNWCNDTLNFHAYYEVFKEMPNFCPECGRKMTKE